MASTVPNRAGHEADEASDLRAVMRGVAATVAIVTGRDGDEPIGMAATSFCSVSMDPPSVLICINRTASLLRAVRSGGGLCLNILSAEDADVCAAFAGAHSQAERFRFHRWAQTAAGLPFLPGAQAVLECVVVREVPHGTHVVVLADVTAARRLRPRPDPLLHLDGAYARAIGLREAERKA